MIPLSKRITAVCSSKRNIVCKLLLLFCRYFSPSFKLILLLVCLKVYGCESPTPDVGLRDKDSELTEVRLPAEQGKEIFQWASPAPVSTLVKIHQCYVVGGDPLSVNSVHALL